MDGLTLPRLDVIDPSWRLAAVVDLETTGFNQASDEILELAIVLFAFSQQEGCIKGVVDDYVGLREPSLQQWGSAHSVNHLHRAMLKGKRIDDERVLNIVDRAEFLVAHNAGFDRRFLRALFPVAEVKPWLCAMNGVCWQARGFASKKMHDLLAARGIWIDEPHRALADARAVLQLLNCTDERGDTYFAELVMDHYPKGAQYVLDRKSTVKSDQDVITQHYGYHELIWSIYSRRDNDPAFLEAAIIACEKQIKIAPEAAEAYGKCMGTVGLPEHWGYRQLAVIREKQGNFEEASRLSKLALKQKWAGDWETRIARCEKRLAKQQPKP